PVPGKTLTSDDWSAQAKLAVVIETANHNTPWPDQTRPLCAYPEMANYKGGGDIESADSFSCRFIR
ncbi:MAG: hypothetical protein JKY14_02255, partial [Paraglaciecola sp.]|nr:hypothetical protein [Paraglaciecola sp.]